MKDACSHSGAVSVDTPAISPSSDADHAGLLTLLQDMQAHYGVPCPPDAVILNDLRSLPSGVSLLVARVPEIVGMAALAAIWPGPGLRRGLFLKELYVRGSHRGQGLGFALMRAASRFALDHEYDRIDWTADRSDPSLLAFYRRLNARELPDKLFFRLAGTELQALSTRV